MNSRSHYLASTGALSGPSRSASIDGQTAFGLFPSSSCFFFCLDGDKFKVRNDDYKMRKGGNGFGVSTRQVCYTLNTVDRHIVALCAPSHKRFAAPAPSGATPPTTENRN